MTKVSVIVPVYNVAKYLRQCMDSLVGQTLRDIEIICVDDGSTDGSVAILAEYAARDFRVKVIHQANAGAGAARNAGLDVATGEYVFFADADDIALPQMLERLYGRGADRSADVVLTGRILQSRRLGRRIPIGVSADFRVCGPVFSGRDCPDRLFVAARTPLWDKLFRRAFVMERGIRCQTVVHSNDLFFSMAALAEAERIVTDDGAYYIHCPSHAGSLQNTKSRAPLAFLEAYDGLERHLGERGLLLGFRVGLCRLLLRCGMREIVRFDDPAVRSSFYGAFRMRFLAGLSNAGKGAFRSAASRWERRLADMIGMETRPEPFLRKSRRRRMRMRCSRLLRFVCGMPIEEVW